MFLSAGRFHFVHSIYVIIVGTQMTDATVACSGVAAYLFYMVLRQAETFVQIKVSQHLDHFTFCGWGREILRSRDDFAELFFVS